MKIKRKQMAFADVMKMTGETHKNPIPQTAFWRWLMVTLSRSEVKKVHFTYDTVGMEQLSADEPALFLMNHSSFTDLQIAATILKDRPFHIVCTNDGLVGKEGLMRRIGCIPTKKFIQDINLIRDMKYAAEQLHSSLLMYPEASYSFDGTETPLPESLGKCIKMLKLPVVMIFAEGAFLRDPLYNGLQQRKADVKATVKYLLSPEAVKEMRPAEINEILETEFHYDHFRNQVKNGIRITEPFRADGLHRALYKCPVCLEEGKMLGQGTRLSCKACGSVWELTEEGLMKKETGKPNLSGDELEYVSDWYAWERDCVKQELLEQSYSMEMDVRIMVWADYQAIYEVGEGHLRHDSRGFVLTGCDGELDFYQSPRASYSLYADYYWYEIGDVISIGDTKHQFYCFPKDAEQTIVAKARIATEELYRMHTGQKGDDCTK